MHSIVGLPDGAVLKNLPANAEDSGDIQSLGQVGKTPWRRKWQPTPVPLSGEFHGQRSLVGYKEVAWGCKELGMSE